MTAESELKEAEEAPREAAGSIQAQEKKIASMKAAGLNTSDAETLLLAYRTAIELATDRYKTLRAMAQNKPAVTGSRRPKRYSNSDDASSL